MGKTSKPIKFVGLGLEKTAELLAMEAQGHQILCLFPGAWIECDNPTEFNLAHEIMTADVVAGPKCWRLLSDQMKWLPLLLKEARAAQPVKPKRTKKASE